MGTPAAQNTKGAVLISGASTGIGRACALHLTRAGFRVCAGVRSKAAGEALEQSAPERLKPILLDITDAGQIDFAADIVASESLCGLVNNAGTAVGGPLEFLPLDEIRRQFEVNLFGHIALTQALLPNLRRAGGRIVNMSSVSGLVGMPFAGPYCSSKFALEAFSDCLRRELKPWKVPVCVVEPGNVKTPIWDKSRVCLEAQAGALSPEAEKYYGKKFRRVRRIAERAFEKAAPPSAVAEAVLRALTDRRPKIRYVVGRDARMASLMRRLLPDWLADRFF